jgi:hypothetical protein
MKYFLFIFIATLNLYSLDFKVASYNVENFFDLNYDKTEYKEYIPNSKTWNNKAFHTKLKNISQVIKDLDADILALQEIESQKVLTVIMQKHPKYTYSYFFKNKHSAIGMALLSKYPIQEITNIPVDKKDKYARDIIQAKVSIEDKPLLIYLNHWRSKRAKESQRIKYALALKKEISTLDKETDYIILGDLNSNYNEFQTFKYDKKLNDTFNITGINQILNTTIDENFVLKNKMLTYTKQIHFNPWLELSQQNRFSTKFREQNNTPDNILLSQGLFDTLNISYVENSFNVFKKGYLYKNNKIKRWNKYKKTGYSDHLPIYAYFSTNKQDTIVKKTSPSNAKNTISTLYTLQQISDFPLKDVVVIYKAKDIAIIKQLDDDKAIMIYKPSDALKIGFMYDLTVNKIDMYFGLKEITATSNIIQKKIFSDYKNLYLDGEKHNLEEYKLINNIVYNLTGIYKKNYLYTHNNKIRLYFSKGITKPKDEDKISITSGHISIYKSSMQIVLHKNEDFRYK